MLDEQERRVAHARANSALIVTADGLMPREVLLAALEFLHQLEQANRFDRAAWLRYNR